jgi:spore coat protein CotH
MQNWDTYGKSIHNYYLYNNPASGKMVWIPWDNNEALQHGKMGGAPSLSFDEINEEWPLIRYIIDDNEWNNAYKQYVSEFSTKFFDTDKMILTYNEYEKLLKDYVVGEQGEKKGYTFLHNNNDFVESIIFLKQHVQERKLAVQDFLDTNNM